MPGIAPDVPHVAAVRGHHQRRPAREPGDQSARDEEVGVDDVRLKAARGLEGATGQGGVTALAAPAPVEHRELYRVPARTQRTLDLGDEDAQIWILGPWIHLRDEKNPHESARDQSERCASYMPNSSRRTSQSSPTVQ